MVKIVTIKTLLFITLFLCSFCFQFVSCSANGDYGEKKVIDSKIQEKFDLGENSLQVLVRLKDDSGTLSEQVNRRIEWFAPQRENVLIGFEKDEFELMRRGMLLKWLILIEVAV